MPIPNSLLSLIVRKVTPNCSDTVYLEDLATEIQGTRVIYHESTFLKINEELAAKTMHATAYQAGLVAKNAQAEALILGHYSSRYPDVNMFKQEAQEVFKNVFLAEDGKMFVLKISIGHLFLRKLTN